MTEVADLALASGNLAREALVVALDGLEYELANGFSRERIERLVKLAREANTVLDLKIQAPKPEARAKVVPESAVEWVKPPHAPASCSTYGLNKVKADRAKRKKTKPQHLPTHKILELASEGLDAHAISRKLHRSATDVKTFLDFSSGWKARTKHARKTPYPLGALSRAGLEILRHTAGSNGVGCDILGKKLKEIFSTAGKNTSDRGFGRNVITTLQSRGFEFETRPDTKGKNGAMLYKLVSQPKWSENS